MPAACLGSVVGGLHLGEVDNVSAHGRGSDEAAIGEVGELVAIDVGALLLLSSPVGSGRAGAVEDAIQVDLDDFVVVVDGGVHHGTLNPRDTRVGNHDIQTAVELLDDLVDGVLDSLGISDIELVGLA